MLSLCDLCASVLHSPLRSEPAAGTADAGAPHRPLGRAGVSRRDRLEHLGFRAAVRLLRTLPHGAALRAGALVGTLLYALDARDRAVGLLNLRIAFPEKSEEERGSILRASCRNLGRVAAEVCHLSKIDRSNLTRYVDFAGRDAWESAIRAASAHGALIATAHFGNWELLAHAHGLLGHPITLVHRPMRNRLVDERVLALRRAAGTRSLSKRSAAREAIRTLRRHGIVAIPIDQNQSAGLGVFVDFFGKPACTTFGVARLAKMTRSPVYPVFLVRQGESARHRIEVLPAIENAGTDEIVATTQRCTEAVEEMIRRHPEQWIWFHKRWRTRPPGEAQFY